MHCRSAVLGRHIKLSTTARNCLLEQYILVSSLFHLLNLPTERRAVTITLFVSRTLGIEL